MEQTTLFKDYRNYAIFKQDKYGKSTLFETEYAVVGLNCLEPGQQFNRHAHLEQNRCYVVLEGTGSATIGEVSSDVAAGMIFYVPEGIVHSIVNNGSERMVLLVNIYPPHAD